MSPQPPVSSTEIMQRTGIPRDVLTFWLRNGLLRPIEAAGGKGKHLRFEWYETNIAAIMNHLRILGMKIEGMLSIVATFRAAISWAESYGLNHGDVWAIKALSMIHGYRNIGSYSDADFAEMMEQYSAEEQGPLRITDRIKALRDQISDDEYKQYVNAYLTITEQPHASDVREAVFNPEFLTYFWRSGEGEKYLFAFGKNAVYASMMEGSVSSIALNIPVILWGVWNNPEDGISARLGRGMEVRAHTNAGNEAE